jgi:hypothetical protein
MAKIPKPRRKQQTVVLDADGTVFEYSGWQGEDHVGRPLPGVVEFARMADYLGYTLVVSTARTGRGLEAIRRAVELAGIPAETTHDKPIGALYIDDRGYRFGGDWRVAAQEIALLLGEPALGDL